jgi:hypothetical protein
VPLPGGDTNTSDLIGDRCYRDIAYSEWASFLGYLSERDGLATLLRLCQPGGADAPAPLPAGSADYLSVYGESFEALTSDWFEALAGN